MSTTMTSREFNQDTARAKRAALEGPVYITDRGEPTLVLLTIEAYRGLSGASRSLADVLAHPESVTVAFEPVISREPPRPADLG